MALRPIRQDRVPLARALGDAAPQSSPPGRVDDLPGDGAAVDDGVVALGGASLVLEDGLLMVFGPDGDPLPPAAFAAAAGLQPDLPIPFADGRAAPAGRVAALLEAQTRGPLAPAGEDAHAWLLAMLGIGAQPQDACADELAVEADACELTLFAKEILISTAAGARFLIAPAASAGPASGTVAVLADDQRAVSVAELITRLRQSAGAPASAAAPAGPASELTLPGFTLATEEDALLIATVTGERFRVVDATGAGPGGARAAILLTDGQAIDVRELLAGLGFIPAHGADAALPEPGAADAAGEARLELPEAAPAALNLALEAILEVDGPQDLGAEDAPVESEPAVTVPLRFGPPLTGGEFAVVYVTGVPVDALLSAGTRSPDGSWLLMPAELEQLTLTLPEALAQPVTVTASAVAIEDRDGAMAALRQQVVIGAPGAVAAGEAPPPTAAERHVPLDLMGLLAALGPDARVNAVVIAGVPPAGRLSAGAFESSLGRWVLRADQLDGLALVLPAGAPGRIALRVKLVTIDPATGQPKVVSRRLEVACVRGERPGGVGFFRPLGARRAPAGAQDRRCAT